MGINESNTIRAYLSTNSVNSDTDFDFCLIDVQKLYRCVQTIYDFEPEDKTLTMNYTGTFLRFESGSKFKLTTVKEEAIQRYLTTPVKAQLDLIYGCTVDAELIKKLNSLEAISSSEHPKIYFAKENNKIVAEIDDKDNVLGDSIGIPISEDISGEWTDIIKVKMEAFRAFNVLGCDTVKFHMTNMKVLEVLNKKEKGEHNITARLLVSVLK